MSRSGDCAWLADESFFACCALDFSSISVLLSAQHWRIAKHMMLARMSSGKFHAKFEVTYLGEISSICAHLCILITFYISISHSVRSDLLENLKRKKAVDSVCTIQLSVSELLSFHRSYFDMTLQCSAQNRLYVRACFTVLNLV